MHMINEVIYVSLNYVRKLICQVVKIVDAFCRSN